MVPILSIRIQTEGTAGLLRLCLDNIIKLYIKTYFNFLNINGKKKIWSSFLEIYTINCLIDTEHKLCIQRRKTNRSNTCIVIVVWHKLTVRQVRRMIEDLCIQRPTEVNMSTIVKQRREGLTPLEGFFRDRFPEDFSGWPPSNLADGADRDQQHHNRHSRAQRRTRPPAPPPKLADVHVKVNEPWMFKVGIWGYIALILASIYTALSWNSISFQSKK